MSKQQPDHPAEQPDAGDNADVRPSETKNAPGKNRRVRIVLLSLGLIALLAGASLLAYHFLEGRYFEETDDAYLQADAITVSPKVDGYVEAVFVRENQEASAGQALVHIDPSDHRAQAEPFEAQIAIAGANANTVRAQIFEQEAAVAQARAELAVAQGNATFSAGEVRPYAPLAERGAESDETLAARRNTAGVAQLGAAVSKTTTAPGERAEAGAWLLRGGGTVFVMPFLNQAAIQPVTSKFASDASRLFNAPRNLGGSLSLAGIAVVQNQRMWLHQCRIEETLHANDDTVQAHLSRQAQSLGGVPQALRSLDGAIQIEALTMTCIDLFWILAVAIACVIPPVLFLRPFNKSAPVTGY